MTESLLSRLEFDFPPGEEVERLIIMARAHADDCDGARAKSFHKLAVALERFKKAAARIRELEADQEKRIERARQYMNRIDELQKRAEKAEAELKATGDLPIEQEVEAMARAICEHFGAASPDMVVDGKPYWMIYEPAARGAREAAKRVQRHHIDASNSL